MRNITTIGIDIAKNIFQIHALDANGKPMLTKRVKRPNLLSTLAQLPISTVGMEACGSAHHWAREITKLGHDVKLMSPQYVKPFVMSNKNDKNDAQGICEALSRPSMRFVPIKSLPQQQISTLHRTREHTVSAKTQLSNHIRGLLAEFGMIANQGYCALKKLLEEVSSGAHDEVLGLSSGLFKQLYHDLLELDKRKKHYDAEIKSLTKENHLGELLMSVPGVGPITASALMYKIVDINDFKHGYDLSAWLGLVPRQCSSGDKLRLYNISKRGDRYLRSLLVHGARAAIKVVIKQNKQDTAYDRWIQQMVHSGKHINKVVVALANKNVRIIWAILKKEQAFNPNFCNYYRAA